MADGSLKFDTKIDTDGFEKDTKTLKDRLNSIVESLKSAGTGVVNAFSDTGSIDVASSKVQALANEIDQYRDALYYLEKQGLYFGDKEYDEVYQKLAKAERGLNQYKKELAGTDKQQKQTIASTKKLNTALKKTSSTSIPLTKSIFKLGNMFKLLILRMAMRSVIRAVQEGFQNLAQYSNQVNKDMSVLVTSAQTLKNSFASAFAPILQVVTPALKVLIDHLSQALSLMGQFFAVLMTGATTFTKATDAQINYAESIANMAKEANKALSPIDKLNVVGDNSSGGYTGPLPSEMFEEIAISNKIVEAVSLIKASLSSLSSWMGKVFAPVFKSVWEGLAPNIGTLKTTMAGMFTDIQSLGAPLLTYFNETLTPSLQAIGITMGEILNGWFDSFNMVFADIWNLAVFPLLQNFITVWMPMYTEFITEMVSLLGVFHEEAKQIFDMVWEEAFAPALELATKIWTDFMELVKSKWDEWGKPTFDNIKEAVRTTADLIKTQWEKYIKPVWDAFMKTADKLWDEHLKPLLDNFMDFVATLVNGALTIYNKFIAPVVKWFIERFGPPIAKVVNFLIRTLGNFMGGVLDAVNVTVRTLTKMIDFIVKVFTGDWKNAWEDVKSIFKSVWEGMVTVVKTPANLIIDIVNGMMAGIVAAVNTVIKAINSISVSIPGWVPVIGGNSIGFNLKQVKTPRIPRLATGTVVPANYGEFLAILGDNKREAEVVSPVSKIEEAVENVLNRRGGASGEIHIHLEGDAKGVFKVVRVAENEHYKQTGQAVFVH